MNTLQGKIEAMRVLEEYEEQNRIDSLKERGVPDDLEARSRPTEAEADFSRINSQVNAHLETFERYVTECHTATEYEVLFNKLKEFRSKLMQR